jgi:hypothetical protein
MAAFLHQGERAPRAAPSHEVFRELDPAQGGGPYPLQTRRRAANRINPPGFH